LLKTSKFGAANGRRREIALALVLLIPLAAIMVAVPPIAQDPQYHAFADRRTIFGIPNFGNVVSNIPFVIVGVYGLGFCLRASPAGARTAWAVLFGGTLLVAFGSAYYHWAPGNATLVWDRLPMTLAFMGLFTAVVSEHAGESLERKLLVPSLVVGVASVAWWLHTDDLRLYAWVQFAPLLAIVFVLSTFPGRYTHRSYLVAGLACYAAAKVAELGDGALYAATGDAVSGHSVKHVLAALATLFVYRMLKRRSPRIAVGR
jgi:hypothetical protein